MSIKQWPSNERPREKLLLRGADALSDAELLAIQLRTGSAGKTAVDLARELLQTSGSLHALFCATQKDLCTIKGFGKAKYAQLHAVLELSRRCLTEELSQGPLLNNASSVKRYLNAKMGHYQSEVFSIILLDNHYQFIAYEELFYGTINSACVYPREVIKTALHHNAAAVIFAHNHPSGQIEPSDADKSITHKLKQALDLLDIQSIDHMIVGLNKVYSFAEQGLI